MAEQHRAPAHLSSVVKGLWICLALSFSAAAQVPMVGDINLYGLRKVPAEKILAAIKVRHGDRLPPSKGDLEDQMEEIPDVVLARVEAVCCEGRDAILFVGIEERGAPHPSLRSLPAGDAVLPPEFVASYRQFLDAVQHAASQGNTAEDLTAGHSLMADPQSRAFQERFAGFAATHVELLRQVLRDGSEAEQRAIAAAVIGYAPHKRDVVDDLQYAIEDADETVRANAMRALSAIAVFNSKNPEQAVPIAPTWFVDLLNSVVLSDRVEAVRALINLTETPNRGALDLMRERALPALIEMARWPTLSYALPPFLLVGRIAGLPDDQIHQYWEKSDREPVIQKATAAGRTSRRR
jgi:hypothetical protein